VADIGKTVSKVTLWSQRGRLLDRQVRANQPCVVDGVRRLDHDAIGSWLLQALAHYKDADVQAIIPVGHGAGVVALVDGKPAFAPLDYEQDLPADVAAAYRIERDDFHLTGSPALPAGLNIGSQLHWLDRLHPEAMERATLLPWAQYWSWFLSGVATTEVTSLGCHSDLWSPGLARFSPLAVRRAWAERFAPLRDAYAVAGPLLPNHAAATGLDSDIDVLVGIHDSNAALLAARGFDEVARREATVLSTGTWFVAMRTPDAQVSLHDLPEDRDCLVNVDAYGWAVPSSRFMGGREIEAILSGAGQVDTHADQAALLDAVTEAMADDVMVLPTFAPGCGPYRQHSGRWVNRPAAPDVLRAATCLYAAMVASASLQLIGARERLIIEGRFSQAQVFVRALASLLPNVAVYVASAETDVSFGALRLVDPQLTPQGTLRRVDPLTADMTDYHARWLERIEQAA